MGKPNVQFDIIWRTAGGQETVLATVTHTFQAPPAPNQSNAVAFDADTQGKPAPAAAGDLLVLKFSVPSGDPGSNYTPNGDGPFAKGRYPSITLP